MRSLVSVGGLHVPGDQLRDLELKEGEPMGGTPPPDEGVTAEEAAAHDAD